MFKPVDAVAFVRDIVNITRVSPLHCCHLQIYNVVALHRARRRNYAMLSLSRILSASRSKSQPISSITSREFIPSKGFAVFYSCLFGIQIFNNFLVNLPSQ